jgi:hypothetical protein
MTTYSAEQIAIIRRMGDISARIRDAAAAHSAAQAEEATHLVDAITALHRAMNRSEEMLRLTTEHGDAFREFLDTL